MMRSRHGRRLFWTIAGVFLLSVLAGTLLQALLVTMVLRPLESREARVRAEVVSAGIAAEMTAAATPLQGRELDSLLSRHWATLGPRSGWIVFRERDGASITAPPGRGRPPLPTGVSPPGPPGPEPPRDMRFRTETVARRAVVRGADTLGEIAVVRPLRPRRVPDSREWQTTLLVLPVAAIVSLTAGLILVRLLVRRLRGMELLAARVAEGDLSVRIADASGDEIGRLAEKLDLMAERLAEARDRLQANETQRRQLFADITHELATPLTSICGYAETMLDPQISVSNDERARFVRGVLEEAGRLDRLIRDLFELARLEAGATPLDKTRLDLAALCRNTHQRFEPRFHAAGLTLRCTLPPQPAWLDADGHRMEQVLENLLVNALRYVPADCTVEIELDTLPERPGWLRLTVCDDGPGLEATELAHIFERFYRGASARTSAASRAGSGSGLGLAIVREIVERHGGSVQARAHAPHGLAIEVRLPALT
jgi:two-component system, OmpR family, sensor histidine kinase BaeS